MTDELPPLIRWAQDNPPLPEPYTEQVVEYSGIAVNRVDRFPLYTADQMRAYGDARAAEELERAAALVESRAGALRTGAYDALIAAAAAIRDL